MFSTLTTELGVLAAFVKKDVRLRTTYKLHMTLSFLNTLTAAVTWSLLGQNAQLDSALAAYGGSFISYLIVGLAFNEYMMESLKAVQKSINPSDLEEILAYPVRLRTFILGNVLWGYTIHTINVLIYFSLGSLVFGVTFGAMDPLGVIITLILGIVVMFSFSLLASGILIVWKQGDVVQWLLGALSGLFAGVYFPITLLPDQLRTISWMLPQTYFFELIRLALNGHLLIDLVRFSIHPLLLTLAVYAFVMLPLGYMVFKKGLAVSKSRGTLSHI